MSLKLKLFLKLSVVFALVVTLVATISVVVLIINLPLEKFITVNRYETVVKENSNRAELLESGSTVDLLELKIFYAFSGIDRPFLTWIKAAKKSGIIEGFRGGRLHINEDVKLIPPVINDCEDLYCYQHRIPFDHMNPTLWKGLIGIEDYRYLDHFGLDPISLLRALVADIKALSMVQGGSTLTQQLVKNLFLTNKKDISRKIVEMIYAIYLESRFSKEEILEAYFNEVWWGVIGGVRVKGVYSASLIYFDKKLHELAPYEVAILVSLLKGPSYYHPIRHTDRLKKRVKVVYEKLVELNLFPNKKSSYWHKKKWQRWIKNLELKNRYKFPRNIWFALKKDRAHLSYYESYVFHNAAERVLTQVKDKVGDRDISIKAIMKPMFKEGKTYKFYSKYERDSSRAIELETHQVGSILKPIIYREFLTLGKRFDDMVSTEKFTLKLKSGNWTPRDHYKGVLKEITLLQALKKSHNRPVIRIANELGFEKLEENLLPLIPELKTPLVEYPSQLLGAIELPLSRVSELYESFVSSECQIPRESSIIFLLSMPSETTISRVVSKELREMNFFGKTGTTNNAFDNWYLFYDGTTLGTIWTGLEGSRDGKQLGISGSWAAFRIFQYYALNRGRRFSELSCPEVP